MTYTLTNQARCRISPHVTTSMSYDVYKCYHLIWRCYNLLAPLPNKGWAKPLFWDDTERPQTLASPTHTIEIHRPIQWAGNLRRTIIRLLSPGAKGPYLKLTAPHHSHTRGSSNLTRLLYQGSHHPLRFGHRGCCSIRVRVPKLTDKATITPMGWLRINLHIFQIWRCLTNPLSIICYCCLLFTNGSLTHSNIAHIQLTCNQQDETLEATSS